MLLLFCASALVRRADPQSFEGWSGAAPPEPQCATFYEVPAEPAVQAFYAKLQLDRAEMGGGEFEELVQASPDITERITDAVTAALGLLRSDVEGLRLQGSLRATVHWSSPRGWPTASVGFDLEVSPLVVFCAAHGAKLARDASLLGSAYDEMQLDRADASKAVAAIADAAARATVQTVLAAAELPYGAQVSAVARNEPVRLPGVPPTLDHPHGSSAASVVLYADPPGRVAAADVVLDLDAASAQSLRDSMRQAGFEFSSPKLVGSHGKQGMQELRGFLKLENAETLLAQHETWSANHKLHLIAGLQKVVGFFQTVSGAAPGLTPARAYLDLAVVEAMPALLQVGQDRLADQAQRLLSARLRLAGKTTTAAARVPTTDAVTATAAGSRCCAPDPDAAKDLQPEGRRQAAIFVVDTAGQKGGRLGRTGHCPRVRTQGEPCAVTGHADTQEVIQTHHVSDAKCLFHGPVASITVCHQSPSVSADGVVQSATALALENGLS